MQPHVERMLVERQELATKCDALLKFMSGEVFPSLSRERRDLMADQYAAMHEYLTALSKRIALE